MNAIQTKRKLALTTGAALLAPAFLSVLATPARADESKNYRTGAAVLGALGVYYAAKGKPLPGAIAGAGAYYAYKKSRDAQKDRYGSYEDYTPRRDDDFYSRRDNRGDSVYDNDYSRDESYSRDDAYDINDSDIFSDDLGYDSVDAARATLK